MFVGGRLVGAFGAKDHAERNVLLIAVSEAPRAHFGHIARAFGVSSETIRLLRRLVEREGPEQTSAEPAPTENEGATLALRAQPVTSGRWVQHVGTWLLLGMLYRQWLYDAVREACADEEMHGPLRMAPDAFACALALGEGCVEGVRRRMTASGHALVRASRAPSATWVRRVVGTLADDRRLDRLGRADDRVHRDVELLSASFAVFVRLWFAHTPNLRDEAKPAARSDAESRYRQFMDYVAHEFTGGRRFLDDLPRESIANDAELEAITEGATAAAGNGGKG